MNSSGRCHAAVCGLVLFSCGSSAALVSTELVGARRAYTEARNGETAHENPRGVHDAYKALQAAENAHAEDPGSSLERNYGYIAMRRAELAIAGASESLARKEQERAEATYRAMLERNSEFAREESARHAEQLTHTAIELQESTQTLQQREAELAEREAQLREAQAAATAARRELEQLESLREQAGRLVITLSGVLFETGGHELSDLAERRLDTVAKALTAYSDRPIVVEGHTDDRGSDDENLELSQRRADAVREYLERRGVESNQIRSLGRGERAPVATNDSPEGRADNRRVEIILEPAGESPQSPRTAPNTSGANGSNDKANEMKAR